MTWSYDATTDIGKVRLLARESVQSTSVFQDEEIQVFLDLETDIRLSAADALEAIADNAVLLFNKVTLSGLTTDGPALAEALRKGAALLRAQVLGYDTAGTFDIAEQSYTPWNASEIFLNDWRRNHG